MVEVFVNELIRSGLRHACICPGSRSTPLTLTLAKHPGIKTWVHVDERAAAFFALGMTRILRQPIAVVCTSGTAAANFFPAVVEASNAELPLLVLTADRPPELWESGANQTIDQTRIYGNYAKWSLNMFPSQSTETRVRYIRTMAGRAMATAIETPSGVVHINFPFPEPLTPPSNLPSILSSFPPNEPNSDSPHVTTTTHRTATHNQVGAVAQQLTETEQGVIICGPQNEPGFPEAISRLASKLAFPILADPLSQVRCGRHDRKLIIDSYGAFLQNDVLSQALRPEIILRFGDTPTSKILHNYLEQNHQAKQFIIREGKWQDPSHLANHVIHADAVQFATDLASMVPNRPLTRWTKKWITIGSDFRKGLDAEISQLAELFEGKTFTELAEILPDESIVFAGNSMPVRDMDNFFPSTSKKTHFIANRGASGIDGVISSALGASSVSLHPLVLVLGDLSFYHDMNGLLAAKQHHLKATIIVINNNGGGIFSFLPQRNQTKVFEEYFGTPHDLDFKASAALYSIGYTRISSWNHFRKAVLRSLTSQDTTIIEIPSNRENNVKLHNQVWSAATNSVKSNLLEKP